jgi:hypothetical protein
MIEFGKGSVPFNSETMQTSRPGFPLFVHAWFRSGSTYIWSKLRNDEKLICYYEPFHEVLGEKTLREQIENHKPSETSLSLRHPVQGRHYFYEYSKLLEEHRLNFSPELSYEDYFLPEHQQDVPRAKYVQTLISHAADVNRLPVLCFCRSQMRSVWIRRNFSGSHIAQIRDPLAQYESFKVQPYFRTTMVRIALDLRRSHPGCFSHVPNVERFGAAFEKRKSLPAEQLYEYFLKPDDFLGMFLFVWLLSAIQSASDSDLLLDIDCLSVDGSYRVFVQEWFAELGCVIDLSDCAIPTDTSVDISKADDMVIEAGRAIKKTPCEMLVYDKKKLTKALMSMSDRSRRAIELFLSQ